MALATTMYHTERNPLKKLHREGAEVVGSVRTGTQRKLHKAFLRYHDPENWPLLREALKKMGRADLIGNGKKQLIPAWQPAGTGQKAAAMVARQTREGQGVRTSTCSRSPRPGGASPRPGAKPAARGPGSFSKPGSAPRKKRTP